MKKLKKRKNLVYKRKHNKVSRGLNKESKKLIEVAVKKVVREYGEALRLLGGE